LWYLKFKRKNKYFVMKGLKENYEEYKVIIVGETESGKSSIVNYYINKQCTINLYSWSFD